MDLQMDTEISSLATLMAEATTYEDAWLTGLELQSFGVERIPALKAVLADGTLVARRASAFWLSDEAETIPPELFLSLSEDEDDDIRYYAAYGLGYMKHPRAVPQLRQMMLNDESVEVRQTAAHSLYPAAVLNNQVQSIIDDYTKALSAEKLAVVREEIVTSLSYFLGTPARNEAILLLKDALEDPNLTVVEQARISLSVLRNEALIVG